MSTSSEAPATPDLSRLTKRQQLNIRVAETQGAHWNAGEFWDKRGNLLYAHLSHADRRVVFLTRLLPDYAGDPAAWGALMEREAVWAVPYSLKAGLFGGCGWVGKWRIRGSLAGTFGYDTAPLSIGEAICGAVLAKHGIDPSHYIGD